MSSRITEKVTLHFDLSNCPQDQQFSLGALGSKYSLNRHTPETLAQYQKTNKALALIPEERLGWVTHFVEDVELPADAVGIHLVTFPNDDPNSIPELALAFIHIPTAAKRRHFRQKRKAPAAESIPSSLTHFGINLDSQSPEAAAAVKLDATSIHSPFSSAETIIFNHPDLMSLKAEYAATVIHNHIGQALLANQQLPDYISANPAKSPTPYYAITVATNPQSQLPINPISVNDKNGNPIKWPQQNGQNVIQQYTLSPAVVGSSDGTQQGIAFSVLAVVLQTTKDDPSLNGQSWSVQHGITSTQQSNVQTQSPSLSTADIGAPTGDTGPGFQWNLSDKTSTYGLSIDANSLTYGPSSTDPSIIELSFNVKNWANRHLGAYVQFFDESGNPINNPWNDGSTDQSKMFVTDLSPGNTLAGIPMWTGATQIGFQVPSNATKADVLLGGIGFGNGDVIDVRGIVLTGVFDIGLPTFMILLDLGITGLRQALGTLDDGDIDLIITTVEQFLGAPQVIISALEDPRSLIASFGQIIVGVIFNKAMPALAAKVSGFVTATEVMDNVPLVGWAFQIASEAAGVANILATTIEIGLSPATYNIEAARVINVQVDVSPDPTHGTSTQKPIWPDESDHWEVVIQYQGGTSFVQQGSMASNMPDTPLSILFSGTSAIPAAPGAQIQITATIYSATDWICGKWTSAWISAAAPDGSTTLTVQGAIIESIVPLTAQTQYSHYQKLAYQNGHHVWEQTTTPPTEVFDGNTDCPNTGNELCTLVDISINDLAYALGYAYQASGQDLPLDFGNDPENGQMYAFQSISVLSDPEAGMKEPSIGFSLQPYISYDQFGPAPLFTLASTYQAELDNANGEAVPSDVATAFASASGSSASGSPATGTGNFTLPAGAVVTVVTAGAEWYIGTSSQQLYDLKLESGTINVFTYPTPAFSPRNYYLDSRSFTEGEKYYLRQVALGDGSNTFDYTTGQSWGAFANVTLDAIAVHPNGYVVGVNYEYHKMLIVQLPSAAVADADAPVALPMSGKGVREGLMQGPIALTITPDGRILVLEQDNARIQAFDTMANPVQCFPGPISFTIDAQFTTDLNSGTISNAFLQAYQQNVQPQLAPSFGLPTTCVDELNAGTVSADIQQQFANNSLPLSSNGPYQVLSTQANAVWLLIDQGSGASYDIRKNLYVLVNNNEQFTIPASLIPDLNNAVASAALIQEFTDYGATLSTNLQVVVATANSEWVLLDKGVTPNVSYTITIQSNVYVYQGSTLLFNLPFGLVNKIKQSGPPPSEIVDQFTGHGITLSSSLQLNVITSGTTWQLVDQGNNVTYDINTEPDLDVFHAPTFTVDVVATNSEWVLRDTVNTLTFDIKPDAQSSALLNVQQLVSVMGLKDGASTNIKYLDIGCETKGFIYVLSYEGTGGAQSDYHLDIYNPDGSWLSRTPENPTSPGVNGARMIVDQWRNLYTLNYETILGPNNRTEPSISTWTPSTPSENS